MLKVHLKARETGYRVVRRLSTDENGVVSFEYVIVAACIVAAVAAAFGTGVGSGIGLALTTAIGDITTAVGTAVTGA